MSGQKYVRPKIERVNVVNPERRPGYRTEAEEAIKRSGKERSTQDRQPFTLIHYQYDAPFFYGNFRVELDRPWENATKQSQVERHDAHYAVRHIYVGVQKPAG